jgi:hypothetical protein
MKKGIKRNLVLIQMMGLGFLFLGVFISLSYSINPLPDDNGALLSLNGSIGIIIAITLVVLVVFVSFFALNLKNKKYSDLRHKISKKRSK